MQEDILKIEQFWQERDQLAHNLGIKEQTTALVSKIINMLDSGSISVCNKNNGEWEVNEWIKKAILLKFILSSNSIQKAGDFCWYDKVENKFTHFTESHFEKAGYRAVPGAYVRIGAYIDKNVVLMPCFVNIGARIGKNSMIDTWSTIGSCAYIGTNCHISGGVGIGGVLEPLQARPVIIEDGCFIGARSEIVEGVIVEEGSVISMGVFIGASTKIVYRDTGEVIYGRVPSYSVVVPGVMPGSRPDLPSLYCAVIVKRVDKQTRDKVAINELLRGDK